MVHKKIFKQCTGYRLGKGEGYADMEYAMMFAMGAVSQETVVVTTVHDCQVVDIPEEVIDEHDLMVSLMPSHKQDEEVIFN